MIPEQLHNEINELEAKLAAKKQEALGRGVETPEKETFRTVFQEHAAPSAAPTPGGVNLSSNPTSASQTSTPRELTEEEKAKIQSLIQQSFTKGVQSAVSEAQKTNNPFFIDSLHDELADQYYEKLIQARKLKQL